MCYAKNTDFVPLESRVSDLVLKYCGDIFNYYLWSYMIETDIPACVMTFRVYGLQDENWSTFLAYF